jgi:hypothetical protein
VLDVPVVGSRSGLPLEIDWATTVSRLRRGSRTGSAPLETGAARLNSVGGLKAVLCVARSRSAASGRNSMPACHVVFAPKSL